jgi:hypothetical protein
LRERARPWTFTHAAEVSGVPEIVIQRFAEDYARTSPALVKCGWGRRAQPQRRQRGHGDSCAARRGRQIRRARRRLLHEQLRRLEHHSAPGWARSPRRESST